MRVSVLFNESKLLKFAPYINEELTSVEGFSTLQRVEIAEIHNAENAATLHVRFSTLQRVEIAEIRRLAGARRRHAAFQYSSTSRNC